jgi:hypothetical protein
MLGSGRIFQYSDEAIAEEPLEYIPDYWTKIWGIDFGIGHPFAAALLLWDRDNDVLHLHHTIRIADQLPLAHVAAMRPVGAAVPVAWPQDGTARSKSDGLPLSMQYKKAGALMLPSHATWPDGSVSTEAGIMELQERMATGRFKAAKQLSDFYEEFHMYHRKDGQIVKIKDDILSALRIAVMQKRSGQAVALGGRFYKRNRGDGIAEGLDFDLFDV